MSAMPDRRPDAAVLRVTDAARSVVIDAKNGERDPEGMALFVEVNGSQNDAYTYDIWFQAVRDAAPTDNVHIDGELAVVVLASSVDKMIGATLDVGDAGLVVVNPNTPPKPMSANTPIPESDLSSPIEQAVIYVLTHEVNPQIASHGGRADLVAVDENNIAYLRLSGGCQGCGMAQVTLSQGISVAIKEGVPEIADVVDITSHGDGTNPFFEAAKK